MIAPAQAAAQAPEVWTNVRHDVIFTQSFPDDVCGPRASTETWRVRTEMNHLTQLPDGSFALTDFETGTIFDDFDDPSIPDSSSQFTNTFQRNLTAAKRSSSRRRSTSSSRQSSEPRTGYTSPRSTALRGSARRSSR